MKPRELVILVAIPVVLFSLACSSQRSASEASYQDAVKQALVQADLNEVKVSEDRDKNTITLEGALHSDEAKAHAGDVAKSAAGPRIVANEISVQPVGAESEAKDIASNRDAAIEKNFKAALIAKGLDKQHIKFDAKNGVLTLKGSVKTATQRFEAQQVAQNVPNVLQVVDDLDLKQ
ncbi:MAG: BON domain-containing protein [Terriglobales bacterium]